MNAGSSCDSAATLSDQTTTGSSSTGKKKRKKKKRTAVDYSSSDTDSDTSNNNNNNIDYSKLPIETLSPTNKNIKRCVRLCTTCFSNDDLYGWLYRNDEQKKTLLSRHIFSYVKHTKTWANNNNNNDNNDNDNCVLLGIRDPNDKNVLLATAVVIPPSCTWDDDDEDDSLEKVLFNYQWQMTNPSLVRARLDCYNDFFDNYISPIHNDCYYLLLLASSPQCKGKNLGVRILNKVLTIAKQNKMNVMLDASCHRLAPYYHRFGFNIVSQKRMPRMDNDDDETHKESCLDLQPLSIVMKTDMI